MRLLITSKQTLLKQRVHCILKTPNNIKVIFWSPYKINAKGNQATINYIHGGHYVHYKS